MKYAGEDSLSKFKRLAEKLNGNALLVTTLDDIAWLLNLRGSDIEYSPVFFSYLVYYPTQTNSIYLYIDASKVEKV